MRRNITLPFLQCCFASVAACALSQPLAADFAGISFSDATAIVEAIPNQEVPDGYVVFRFFANFNDPLDAFLNVSVVMSFTHDLYQNPFGGDGPPNPALFSVPGFENLAADSFVTHGVSQQPIDNLGFDPDFQMLPDGIVGGWFDSNPLTPTLPDANGQILLAQLTLPEGGATTGLFAGTIFYEDPQIPGTATQGEWNIPAAPGALPLLALVAVRRSRRR
jgi:hypothetical protein